MLAPYVLTALITRPQRLVYLSSGVQTGGDAALDDPQREKRRWNGAQAYADSKFDDLLLTLPSHAAGRSAFQCDRTRVYHQKARRTHPAAHDPRRQDALLDYCAVVTSTPLPDP